MVKRGTEKNMEEKATAVSAPRIELHTKLKKKSLYPFFSVMNRYSL